MSLLKFKFAPLVGLVSYKATHPLTFRMSTTKYFQLLQTYEYDYGCSYIRRTVLWLRHVLYQAYLDLTANLRKNITANNLAMKLLYTICFMTITLGSTVALPVVNEQSQIESDSSDTGIIDFNKLEKRAVSRCKINFSFIMHMHGVQFVHL